MALSIDESLEFAATTANSDLDFSRFEDRVGDGFNEYGVRENTDDEGNLTSVDVIFEAMEPGPPERRNGVRITEEFLQNVADKKYASDPPHLRDHEDKNTFARMGRVKDVWFDEQLGKLMLMTRTPNIQGSQTYSEAIARYTHDPPEITDGSVGFGNQYKAVRNDDGEPELVDGKLREFSSVNFPGGYDDGGIKAAFAEAAVEAVSEFDDVEDDTPSDGDSAENSATESEEDATFEAVSTETITF